MSLMFVELFSELRNIEKVVQMDLCTGCGTCVAFCPQEAINIKNDDSRGVYIPEINAAKCNSCGICLKVCPGMEIDFRELNIALFGQEPSNLLGNHLKCFSGYSNSFNSETTVTVSSGGAATQLLITALEKGLVDGALVTRMRKDNPLKPETIIAETANEIVSAAGSKYCPCPTNLGLKEVLKKEGRFAAVGVPCHIHAIRKAQQIFPELRKKIPITIGLFCAHATSFKGTEAVLRKLRVSKNQTSKLTYRGHGWPGYLCVETTDGRSYRLPLSKSFKSYYPVFDSYLFVPWCCLFCQDHFNQLADISVGDAWLPEFAGSKIGQSLLVVRSDIGQELVKKAVSSKALTLKPIQSERVVKSQHHAVRFKSRDWHVRLSLAVRMRKNPPLHNINVAQFSSSIGSYVINIFRMQSAKLRKTELRTAILSALPLWLYRIYNAILNLVARLP